MTVAAVETCNERTVTCQSSELKTPVLTWVDHKIETLSFTAIV